MAKKFVATIMNRLFLGDGKYVYYVSHPEIGEFDLETQVFKDRNGIEYLSIMNRNLLKSEITQGYANLTEYEKLPTVMNAESMKDAITDFNYLCSRHIYYVSNTDENNVFCIPIDLEAMRDSLTQSMNEINEKGGLEKLAREYAHSNDSDDEMDSEYDDDKLSNLEDAVHAKELRDDIAIILLDIMDGEYSLEELRELREIVAEQRDGMEMLVDALDIQIEATEKGESSVTLKNEEKSLQNLNVKKREEGDFDKLKKKIQHYIDIEDLYKKVTSTLIAQDEPTKRVITEIVRKEQNPDSKSRGILITGPTGSGKTKMMELIAKYIDYPFHKVDSTQLTIPGYVGKDIEEELWDLYEKCGRDINRAEHAIIFFDEIDKKGSSRKEDSSGRGVLNVLLPFIEGSTYDACRSMKVKSEVVPINTKNMIVILGGAFTDVYKSLNDRNAIGFGVDQSKDAKKRVATTQDFVDMAKMPDEFMGRVSVVKLNDLDAQAIRRIILESDESAVRIQKKLFEELGVKLTLGDDYIDAIVDMAEKRKTGARGINTVVDETTWEAYGDAYSHLGEYSEIILSAETIENPKQYKKILKKKTEC